MRESTIELNICVYALSKKWSHYKFSSPGHRGVPDHIFCKFPAQIIFIEFKAPGEVSTPQQKHEQQRLRDQGFAVYEVSSIEMGHAIFN